MRAWRLLLILPISLACAGGCSGAGAGTGPSTRAELHGADRVLTPQRRGDWCWAACCEMALKYNGNHTITQEMLVQDLKGDVDDQTAIDWQIVKALATDPDKRPRATKLPSDVRLNTQALIGAIQRYGTLYSSPDSAVEDFAQGHPLLMGLKDWNDAPGHIVFVTAIDYTDDRSPPPANESIKKFWSDVQALGDALIGNNRYSIRQIEFYDPMPGTGGHKVLDAHELERHHRFYLTRKKAREIIEGIDQSVQFR